MGEYSSPFKLITASIISTSGLSLEILPIRKEFCGLSIKEIESPAKPIEPITIPPNVPLVKKSQGSVTSLNSVL